MKKQNQVRGIKLRKIIALALVAVSITGMLPMENVQALKKAAVLRDDIEKKDWSETEQKEENIPQEEQGLEVQEHEPEKETAAEAMQPEKMPMENGDFEETPDKEILAENQLDKEIKIPEEMPNAEFIAVEFSVEEHLYEEQLSEEPSYTEYFFEECFVEASFVEESFIEASSFAEFVSEESSVSEEKPVEEVFGFSLSADNDGVYNYRTYYRTTPYLYITMNEGWLYTQKESGAYTGGDEMSDEISDETGELVFYITSQNESVAAADISRAKPLKREDIVVADSDREYLLEDGKIPLIIRGIGKTTLDVTAKVKNEKLRASCKIMIEVKDSPFCDADFEIKIIGKDNKEKEHFTDLQKWQNYLAEHDNWIKDNVYLGLTDTGLKYYNKLIFKYGKIYPEWGKQYHVTDDMIITDCNFQLQNDRTGAKAYMPEGAGSFKMGIDKTIPVIQTFTPSKDYYTCTSTEDKQYFPKSFILTGSIWDSTSGIAAIEYTTEMNEGNKAVWKTLEQFEEAPNKAEFTLVLENGVYNAIAVRVVDKAGNISEPACLKNEADNFIKIIVDDTPPDIEVLAVSEGEVYSADSENWTNKAIQFTVSKKPQKDMGNIPIIKDYEDYAGLYSVEYAYQSAASVLCGETISEDAWHTLVIDENQTASFCIGNSIENPINQNGYYYFKGISKTGVSSEKNVEKRILLWQKPALKRPLIQTSSDLEKCHNEWYNIASGVPIIDFEYPIYDTGVISGEYGAPITLHYNLTVEDENNIITSVAKDKKATIQADISENISTDKPFTEFPIIKDDLSNMQVTFPTDGIYTLEYWITDAAGNESEKDCFTYKIDCNEPTDLKLILENEEQIIGNESTLFYEKFYQEGISGHAAASYGISGKESIKILKARQIGDWKTVSLKEDAEQFQINPNMRCLIYVRATDGAGNMTEGWTKGIVVDNEAPAGDGAPEMIIQPEGANKHGFFNKDVTVNIRIKDAPDDQNSAALKLVTETISVDGTDRIVNKELFSSMEESISQEMIAESEKFIFSEIIKAKENEGNSVSITVDAIDRSENKSTYTQELKIDVTKPEISITFDNENAINGRYYNTDRRAKINIKELNFDSSLVKVYVEKDGNEFSPTISEWHSDKNNHYAYLDFTADGDYTFRVTCRDLADNDADEESATPFTIDKTMPSIEIALETDDIQTQYFNESQTAVITVVEHNFNADDFGIKMQPVGKIGAWEHKNDTHVIKVEFLSEGAYSLSCEYQDLAGNNLPDADKAKMPIEFVIDKTAPSIVISGVKDNSANAGEVVPVITVSDTNIEPLGTTITLTTGKGVTMEIVPDITTTFAENGFTYTLNGLDAKPDDIYYLAVNTVDKAQNMSKLTYRFSLNRRGSAYDITDLANLTKQYYNSYRTLEDIKIIEMNVDKVEDFELYLSHNSDIIYGKQGDRPLSAAENLLPPSMLYGVSVSGSEDTGYVYTYTIYRENFTHEGTYRMGIYSRDRAGNEVNNLLKLNGEEIQFVIDNTLPRVMIEGIEDNEIYDVESQEVRIRADDNFKLADAWLTLVNKEGEVLDRWNYFDFVEKEGDTAVITIGEHKEEVSLLYCATDAAGNEMRILQDEKTAKSDFLVTTDKLVQLVNKPTKTPIGRFMIGATVLFIISLAGIFVIAGRKRKGKNTR